MAQSLLRLGKFKEAYEELQKIPEEDPPSLEGRRIPSFGVPYTNKVFKMDL